MSIPIIPDTNTYDSVLAVKVVSAGVVVSACLKIGKHEPGTRDVVHLDCGDSREEQDASSNHDVVLKFNSTSRAKNGNICSRVSDLIK